MTKKKTGASVLGADTLLVEFYDISYTEMKKSEMEKTEENGQEKIYNKEKEKKNKREKIRKADGAELEFFLNPLVSYIDFNIEDGKLENSGGLVAGWNISVNSGVFGKNEGRRSRMLIKIEDDSILKNEYTYIKESGIFKNGNMKYKMEKLWKEKWSL